MCFHDITILNVRAQFPQMVLQPDFTGESLNLSYVLVFSQLRARELGFAMACLHTAKVGGTAVDSVEMYLGEAWHWWGP